MQPLKKVEQNVVKCIESVSYLIKNAIKANFCSTMNELSDMKQNRVDQTCELLK